MDQHYRSTQPLVTGKEWTRLNQLTGHAEVEKQALVGDTARAEEKKHGSTLRMLLVKRGGGKKDRQKKRKNQRKQERKKVRMKERKKVRQKERKKK